MIKQGNSESARCIAEFSDLVLEGAYLGIIDRSDQEPPRQNAAFEPANDIQLAIYEAFLRQYEGAVLMEFSRRYVSGNGTLAPVCQ